MMDNLISRQVAIEGVRELFSMGDCYCDELSIVGMLNSLPSVQPERIYCKDCKHHWTHRCMDSMPMEICDLQQTFYDANIDYCSLAERREDG